jgi:glucitol operon activator protein
MTSMTVLFLILFGVMALQMFLGLIQVREYKQAMNSYRGTGIVGLGHTKGTFSKMGKIVVLSYNSRQDKVVGCKIMKGFSIFAKFKVVTAYDGMSLSQVRQAALDEDAKEFKSRRKRHPYDPKEFSKKKGALIQAIEAIDGRLEREEHKEQQGEPAAATESLHDAAIKKAREQKKLDRLERADAEEALSQS